MIAQAHAKVLHAVFLSILDFLNLFSCCFVAVCDDPGDVANAVRIRDGGYRVDEQVQFACDVGYALEGDEFIRCMPNREWSAPVPVCRQGSCFVFRSGTLDGPRFGGFSCV